MSEIAEIIARGMPHQPVWFLHRYENVQRYGHLAVKCGACVFACNHRKDVQVAWCRTHRCMVSTTSLVLCTAYTEKK